MTHESQAKLLSTTPKPLHELPKTYFDLIEKVGSDGSYQRNMFLIFFLMYFVSGAVMLSTAFNFLNNEYECLNFGLVVQDCREYVCQLLDSKQRDTFFIKNKEDIQSIATDFGPFICEDQYLLDMMMSCTYLGAFIGYAIFSAFSDNFGRRSTMIMSVSVSTLGCMLISLSVNIPMIVAGMLIAGSGIDPSSNMTFYFLGQTVESKKRQKYSTFLQVAYTIGAIFSTGFYYFLKQWRIVIILLYTLPLVLILILVILYLQETPSFLLTQSNASALKSLNRIGYINFKIKDILNEQDIQSVRKQQLTLCQHKKKQKVSYWDLLKYPSLRSTTIVSCLLCFIIVGSYFGPSLIIDKIGFNMFITNLVVSFSEIIGQVPCILYIDKVKRVKAGAWLFAIAIVSSLTLVFVEKPQDCEMCLQSVLQLVMIFFYKFAVSTLYIFIIIYVVELFPSRVVGLGAGSANAFGIISSAFMPIILGSLERAKFNLMIFFFLMAAIGFCLVLLLEQTYGKPLKVEIQQKLQESTQQQTSQNTLN